MVRPFSLGLRGTKSGARLNVTGFVISNPFSSKLLTVSRNRLHEGRRDPVLKDLVREHGQIVTDQLAEDLVHLSHRVP